MQYVVPAYPWFDMGRKWVLRDGKMVPTKHAAGMMGISKPELQLIMQELKIEPVFPDPVAGSRSYDSYLLTTDFPTILRHRGKSEEVIEAAMQQFEDVKNRTRMKRGPKSKKNYDDYDDDDDDDDNDLSVVVLGSNRKRRTMTDDSTGGDGVVQLVKQHLNRVESMYQKCLDLQGEDALPEYMKTQHWADLKHKALQKALKDEFPTLKEDVKKELWAHWEPKIKEQLRQKAQDEDAEQEMLHNVLSRQQRQKTDAAAAESVVSPLSF